MAAWMFEAKGFLYVARQQAGHTMRKSRNITGQNRSPMF